MVKMHPPMGLMNLLGCFDTSVPRTHANGIVGVGDAMPSA